MSSTSKPTLKIDWCSHEAAKHAVVNWHYSGSLPVGKSVKVGAWEDGKFIGVVIFAYGANNNIGKPYGLQQVECCELVRVALANHKTAVSKIVAIALRFLKNQADPIRHGHQQIDLGVDERGWLTARQNQHAPRGMAVNHRQPDSRLGSQFAQLRIHLGVRARRRRQDGRPAAHHGRHIAILGARQRLMQHLLGQTNRRQWGERPCPRRVQQHDDIRRIQLRKRQQHPIEQEIQRTGLAQDGQQASEAGGIADRRPRRPQSRIAGRAQAANIVPLRPRWIARRDETGPRRRLQRWVHDRARVCYKARAVSVALCVPNTPAVRANSPQQ